MPQDVEKRLESLSMVETFAAVRRLHEAIRADGESPARLAALARAYAQLGMLTEFLWSPAHRVFKARALLYAERLKQRASAPGWPRHSMPGHSSGPWSAAMTWRSTISTRRPSSSEESRKGCNFIAGAVVAASDRRLPEGRP